VPDKKSSVNLRTVADHVGLAPCSVSAILNNTPASQAIPQTTKDRVLRAAAELNYRPNLWARSLRTKRTRMVAVIAPDFGRGAVAKVIAGAQARLYKRGYLLALASLADAEALHHSALLQQRGIEGLIAVDADVAHEIELPVANVDLDYVISSEMAMQDTSTWLAALGETAAETVIRQVENTNISRRMKVDPKLPAAFFDLQSARLAGRDGARETA
jgi:DNA-binding LacI/PurR family transcriptional regulator